MEGGVLGPVAVDPMNNLGGTTGSDSPEEGDKEVLREGL